MLDHRKAGKEEVSELVGGVVKLAALAQTQAKACYVAAYTNNIGGPLDIQYLLEPLEKAISQVLIPAITERNCNNYIETFCLFQFAWEAYMPWKPKPGIKLGVRFISQSDNATR